MTHSHGPRDIGDEGRDEPIKVLGRLPLPRPSRVDDVATDFDRWIRDHVPIEEQGILLFGWISQPSTAHERTLMEFLSIVQADPGTWPGKPDFASLIRSIGNIIARLSPADTVVAFLEDRARAYASRSLESALSEMSGIQRLLVDSELHLKPDGTVSLGFEATLPIGRLLEFYRDHGIALYDLRSRMAGDLGAFEAALAEGATRLAPGIERGLVQIFDGAEADPIAYVTILRPALAEVQALALILAELQRRSGLDDGFRDGPDAAEWLRVVSVLGPWRARDVESLLRLETIFRRSSAAFLPAVVSGALSASSERPSIAVFAGLSVLRLARRQRLASRRISDADTERAVADAMSQLGQGHAILGLDGLLSELPVDVAGENSVWPYLGKGEKGIWERRLRNAIGDDRDLREGTCMFLLASSSRETYADVYHLVIGLLGTEQALDFLRSLVPSRNALIALRAEHLVRELPYAIPA